jgi:hypothetical protein
MSMARKLMLALAYAGGLGWAAYELQRPAANTAEDIEPKAVVLPEISMPIAFSATIDAYNAITERPLFSSDRKPRTAVVAEEPTAELPIPDALPVDMAGMRVSAIFRGSGTLSALIELYDGETQLVRQGDKVGNWEVLEILDDRIVLGGLGQRRTLEVYQFSQVAPPPPADPRTLRRSRRALPPTPIPNGTRVPPDDPRNIPQTPGRLVDPSKDFD